MANAEAASLASGCFYASNDTFRDWDFFATLYRQYSLHTFKLQPSLIESSAER